MKIHHTSYKCVDESQDTASEDFIRTHHEFSSSKDGASKIRTRLKNLNKTNGQLEFTEIESGEVEVNPTRDGIIAFVNKLTAHSSWVVSE